MIIGVGAAQYRPRIRYRACRISERSSTSDHGTQRITRSDFAPAKADRYDPRSWRRVCLPCRPADAASAHARQSLSSITDARPGATRTFIREAPAPVSISSIPSTSCEHHCSRHGDWASLPVYSLLTITWQRDGARLQAERHDYRGADFALPPRRQYADNGIRIRQTPGASHGPDNNGIAPRIAFTWNGESAAQPYCIS